ncbi:MAG: aminotransferase class IV [Aquificaceae bacterium]
MVNRTLLFGEGLFETLRWRPSEEKLRLHYERLRSSAEFFHIPCPDYEEFKRDLETATKGEEDLYVKYLLISKGGDYITDRPTGSEKLIITKGIGHIPNRVRLTLSPYRRHSLDPVCRHKSTSYLFSLLVKRHAKEMGFWDGLIVNEKGHICESSTANLLFIKGSHLYTPAKECGLLWGTTLEFIRRRFPIREEYIPLEKMEAFEGMFVLNSLILCAVVEEVNGKTMRVDLSAFEELRSILRACL